MYASYEGSRVGLVLIVLGGNYSGYMDAYHWGLYWDKEKYNGIMGGHESNIRPVLEGGGSSR